MYFQEFLNLVWALHKCINNCLRDNVRSALEKDCKIWSMGNNMVRIQYRKVSRRDRNEKANLPTENLLTTDSLQWWNSEAQQQ